MNQNKIIKYDNTKSLTKNVIEIINEFLNNPKEDYEKDNILQFFKEGLIIENIDIEIKAKIIQKLFKLGNIYMEISSILPEFFIKQKLININMDNFKSIKNNNFLKQLFNSICIKEDIASFLIYNMSFYLKNPKEDEYINYIENEYKNFKDYLDALLLNPQDYYKIIYITFIKHYLKIFSLYCSNLLDGKILNNDYNDNILNLINEYIIKKGDDNYLIQNIKIYILKIIISKLSINPSNLLNYNIEEKCKINWIPKAQLEIENNSLGLIPHISLFDKSRKEIEPILENLIKEPNINNINIFIEFIKNNENDCSIKYSEKIKDNLSKKPFSDINDIYIETQIVCCQLKYENKIDKNKNLINYINEKNMKTPFLKYEKFINEILLCNIIDFYELLENFIFDNIIETISPDFKNKIENENEIEKKLEEMFQPENNNIYPSLNQTIDAIKRFTVRCLLTDIESKFNLVLYIVRGDFWNIDITEEQIDNFSRDFPEEILINNTYELYKMLFKIGTKFKE